MNHTVQFLIQHGYLLLFCWLLAEQAALPVPSIPLLLACGAVARAGRLNPVLILLYGLAACLLADTVWFQLGKRRGSKILQFICRIALEPDSCVRQTENAFLKYGLRSMLFAKFVPGLNAVAAPMAGSSGASLGRFLWFDGLGSLFWMASYATVGYLFSDQLEIMAAYALRMGSGLVLLVVGLLTAWIAWKFVQRRRFLRKYSAARVTAEQLRDKIRAGADVLLVDLRHDLANDLEPIPGALRISVEELEARHSEIPRDREIILFCS
ncbi:MAG: VTT domain-containing protein [Acidobacteriia bacterium]|nr:VTT domain-containing protein [Terriglobia bacterium]